MRAALARRIKPPHPTHPKRSVDKHAVDGRIGINGRHPPTMDEINHPHPVDRRGKTQRNETSNRIEAGLTAVRSRQRLATTPPCRQPLVIDVAAGPAQGDPRPWYSVDQHTIVLVAKVRHHICSVCCSWCRCRSAGIREGPAQRLQVLALVQLPGDASPAHLVGQVPGRVDGAAQRPVLLERAAQRVLLPLGGAQLSHDERGDGVSALRAGGDPQQVVPHGVRRRQTHLIGNGGYHRHSRGVQVSSPRLRPQGSVLD